MQTVSQTMTATYTVAATYERVSTLMQAKKGRSLVAQARDDALFAEQQGWHLPEHLRWVDTDSGADWDLEGFQAMLEAARRREFQVLIVPDPDRFARDMLKALTHEQQLEEYGVRVVYRSLPLDTDSDEGVLGKNIIHAIAHYERRKIRRRTMGGRREKAKAGKVVGNGVPPYGYRWEWSTPTEADQRPEIVGMRIDAERAFWVRRLFALLARLSAADVATVLEAEGAPRSARSKRWSAEQVRRIGINPVYVGTMTYARGGDSRAAMLEGIRIPCEAVVTPADWDAVQAGLDRRQATRRKRGDGEDAWLLRGMLRCGHCGGMLSIDQQRHRGKVYRYYACLRNDRPLAARRGWEWCPQRLVAAEGLEAAAWDALVDALTDAERLEANVGRVRAQYAERDAVRADTERVLGAQLEKARETLKAAVYEKLGLRGRTDDPRYAIYAAAEAEAAARVMALQGKLAALAAEAPRMPSGRALDSALAFGARLRKGAARAGTADKRELLETLQLAGVVRAEVREKARAGEPTRWGAEWGALVPLDAEGRGVGDGDAGFFKLVLLSATAS